MISETILPCKCGATGILNRYEIDKNGQVWQIKCSKCKLITRGFSSRTEAINNWNYGDMEES